MTYFKKPVRYPNLSFLSTNATLPELVRAFNEIRDYFIRLTAETVAQPLTDQEKIALLAHLAVIDGNPHGTDHNDTEKLQGGKVGERFHLTSAQEDEVDALDRLGLGVAVKTGSAVWEARQIAGTADEVEVSNGDGQAGNPTIGLPARIAGPRRFGGETDYAEFEASGTLRFAGAATVWEDVYFPMAPPKTTGAGNPTLTTYNGNLRGYAFAVNDAHDFDPQEMEHKSKVGSTATWHVHWLSRASDPDDRTVKWEIEYDVEPASGALPAPATASVEIVIPAATAVNTVQRDDITTFTIPAIARLVGARIKRVASSGTEPSVDPVLRGLHFHFEVDQVGSREILSK